jgi:hypothetical protein
MEVSTTAMLWTRGTGKYGDTWTMVHVCSFLDLTIEKLTAHIVLEEHQLLAKVCNPRNQIVAVQADGALMGVGDRKEISFTGDLNGLPS